MRNKKVKMIISTMAVMILIVGIVPINAFALSKLPLVVVQWTREWTRDDITLRVFANIVEGNGGWIEEIILPDGSKAIATDERALSFTATYPATSNGNYTFKVKDNDGDIVERTITVDKIDRLKPTKPIVTKIDNKLVLTPGTDTQSGIDKHMYNLNNGNWLELTNDIDIVDFEPGDYMVRIKAIDKATNESEIFELNFNVENKIDYKDIIKNIDSFEDLEDIEDLINSIEDKSLKEGLRDLLEKNLMKFKKMKKEY